MVHLWRLSLSAVGSFSDIFPLFPYQQFSGGNLSVGYGYGAMAEDTHAPAEKTLSAIVREIVNDETIVPPRDPSHGYPGSGMRF